MDTPVCFSWFGRAPFCSWYFRQQRSSDFVSTVCVSLFPVSIWRCTCAQSQLPKEIAFPSLLWKNLTTSNTFGINWNTDCEPDLIAQHQCWTSPAGTTCWSSTYGCNLGCPHTFGYVLYLPVGSIWIRFSLNHCQHTGETKRHHTNSTGRLIQGKPPQQRPLRSLFISVLSNSFTSTGKWNRRKQHCAAKMLEDQTLNFML